MAAQPTFLPASLGLLALIASSAWAAPAPAPATPAVNSGLPDYALPASWLCRPGAEQACTARLDATEIEPNGSHRHLSFTPAASPGIDCFYVYPTASREDSDYADMDPSPELIDVTNAQAGRLAGLCRLYVPIYRQLTGQGLGYALHHGRKIDWSKPYRDVLAAWRYYLAHENGGRGVVLVGHSQGSILLQRLLAEEIDGKPAQSLLVSAFLGGAPSFTTRRGKDSGGTLAHIPLCHAASQTGCVYVWASYPEKETATPIFGRDGKGDLAGACASPAAPAGGKAALHAMLDAPTTKEWKDALYIALTTQLSGQCVSEPGGAVLRVAPNPGPMAEGLNRTLQERRSGWGLHWADLGLVQGDMLADVKAEQAAWAKHAK